MFYTNNRNFRLDFIFLFFSYFLSIVFKMYSEIGNQSVADIKAYLEKLYFQFSQ